MKVLQSKNREVCRPLIPQTQTTIIELGNFKQKKFYTSKQSIALLQNFFYILQQRTHRLLRRFIYKAAAMPLSLIGGEKILIRLCARQKYVLLLKYKY